MSDADDVSEREPRVTDSPETIWLQYGDIESDCTHAECYRDGDVSWCEDAIYTSDVRYVRADRYDALQREMERLGEAADPYGDGMSEFTEFDYALNRMEHAGACPEPAKNGYGEHRRALFAYVRNLESQAAEIADLKRIRVAVIAERDALRADAERYRWLADHARSTSEHWGGRWSLVIDGPAPVRHDCVAALDAAIDAARAALNPKEQT